LYKSEFVQFGDFVGIPLGSFPICQEFHLSKKMDCIYTHYCTN